MRSESAFPVLVLLALSLVVIYPVAPYDAVAIGLMLLLALGRAARRHGGRG